MVDFPVKTYPQPAKEPASTESDPGYSLNSCGSFAWLDHSSSSWKTYQRLLLGGWESFSGNWPAQGLMLNGAVYPQPAWERPISAGGSSLWPTPAGHHAKMGNHDEPIENYLERVRQYEIGNYKGKPGRSLGVAVRLAASHGAGPVTATGLSAGALGITTETLSTAQRSPGRWPTPSATDWKGSTTAEQRRRQLSAAPGIVGGKLNPEWVEWLMGFPPGWTDLEP